MAFQHRLIHRSIIFVYKLHLSNGSKNLKDAMTLNSDLQKQHSLRNLNQFAIPSISKYNDYGKNTFNYIFSRISNEFGDYLNINTLSLLKIIVKNNINLIFIRFLTLEEKLDVNYVQIFKN
jgi:hypothetical protein